MVGGVDGINGWVKFMIYLLLCVGLAFFSFEL